MTRPIKLEIGDRVRVTGNTDKDSPIQYHYMKVGGEGEVTGPLDRYGFIEVGGPDEDCPDNLIHQDILRKHLRKLPDRGTPKSSKEPDNSSELSDRKKGAK